MLVSFKFVCLLLLVSVPQTHTGSYTAKPPCPVRSGLDSMNNKRHFYEKQICVNEELTWIWGSLSQRLQIAGAVASCSHERERLLCRQKLSDTAKASGHSSWHLLSQYFKCISPQRVFPCIKYFPFTNSGELPIIWSSLIDTSLGWKVFIICIQDVRYRDLCQERWGVADYC